MTSAIGYTLLAWCVLVLFLIPMELPARPIARHRTPAETLITAFFWGLAAAAATHVLGWWT